MELNELEISEQHAIIVIFFMLKISFRFRVKCFFFRLYFISFNIEIEIKCSCALLLSLIAYYAHTFMVNEIELNTMFVHNTHSDCD